MTDFYKKVGMESNTNAYSSTGFTPLASALFNIRYVFHDTEIPNNNVTTLLGTSNRLYLYENNHVLSIGYAIGMTSEEFATVWDLNSNAVTTQNNFVKNIVGINRPDSSEDKVQRYTAFKDGYYFFYTSNTTMDDVEVSVEGRATKKTGSLKRRYFVSVGYVEAGKTIKVSTPNDVKITGNLYYFNGDVLADTVDALKPGCLAVTDYDSTHVNGLVKANSNGILFTTIPYEKGWTARVDGVIVDTEKCLDTFLAIPITAGTHKIELTYIPDGLMPGLWITLGSILFLVCITMLRSIFKQKFGYRFNVFVEEEEIDLRDLDANAESEETPKDASTEKAEEAKETKSVDEEPESPVKAEETAPEAEKDPDNKETQKKPEAEEKADEVKSEEKSDSADDTKADDETKETPAEDKPEADEATKTEGNDKPNANNNGNNNRKHFGKKKRNKLK